MFIFDSYEYVVQMFFWIIRYGLVALLLTYLVNVFVKKQDIRADMEGHVLEWRVDAYKKVHRWVMGLQSIIAAPNQLEEQYKAMLASSKFKIGYQGMEYATLFDNPEKAMAFNMAFNHMLNKERNQIDYILEHKLNDFQLWIDDVIMLLGAFVSTECDKHWHMSEKEREEHCNMGCRVMGIALQKDVDNFFEQIDNILRDRLRNLKIANLYHDAIRARILRKVTDFCESVIGKEGNVWYKNMVVWLYFHYVYRTYGCSQLQKHSSDLFAIFVKVHFHELIMNGQVKKISQKEFMKMVNEYKDMFNKHLKVYEYHGDA